MLLTVRTGVEHLRADGGGFKSFLEKENVVKREDQNSGEYTDDEEILGEFSDHKFCL